MLALSAVAAGNALALLAAEPLLALVARAIVGIGSGAGFVAGAAYMRAVGPSPALQGLYGGATMAGGGLAIAVVPQLESWVGWRAPYWSALAIAALTAAVLLAAPRAGAPPAQSRGARLLGDRSLLRLGAVHAATFGLSVVLANWVVALLEHQGHDRGRAAFLGAFVLLAGIATRPLGGVIVSSRPPQARLAVGVSLLAMGAGSLALALPLPLAVLGAACIVVGLSAGLPFAYVFGRALSLRPDAPAAALGFVNAWAVLVVVVGTPLLGLTFSLPGEGRIGFAIAGVLASVAILALRRPFASSEQLS